MDAITAESPALSLFVGSDPDVTATFEVPDDSTEQMAALTVEQTLFDEPMPLPPSAHGDPAYFVEVKPPRGAPRLLAVRTNLADALHVAHGVHPSVADVVIRELSLPCDAASLERAATHARTWSREPNGRWTPEISGGSTT